MFVFRYFRGENAAYLEAIQAQQQIAAAILQGHAAIAASQQDLQQPHKRPRMDPSLAAHHAALISAQHAAAQQQHQQQAALSAAASTQQTSTQPPQPHPSLSRHPPSAVAASSNNPGPSLATPLTIDTRDAVKVRRLYAVDRLFKDPEKNKPEICIKILRLALGRRGTPALFQRTKYMEYIYLSVCVYMYQVSFFQKPASKKGAQKNSKV